MAQTKAKDNSTEIYVIEVFGIPLIRKYVEVCSVGQVTSASSHSQVLGRLIKIFLIISMLISILVPVTTVVCVFYHPPPVLRELADRFLAIYSTKANVEELQNNLTVCEAEKGKLNGTLRHFFSDYVKILNKEKEDSRKLENELRGEIAKLEKTKEVYQTNEIHQLTQNLTLMKRKNLDVEQELLTAKEMIRKLERKESKLESRFGDLEKNLEESKKENTALSKQLSEAEETINKMENNDKEKERMMKHNIEVKEECQKNSITSERKIQQTKDKVIAKLKDDAKDLNNKLHIMTGQKVTITENYEDTKSKLRLCENKTMDYESSISKQQDELKQVKEESKNRTIEHQNDKEQLEAQLTVSKKEFEQTKKMLITSEESANNLTDNLNNMTKEILALKERIDDTEVMLGSCRNKNMDHELEKTEILRKLQKAERELKNCH